MANTESGWQIGIWSPNPPINPESESAEEWAERERQAMLHAGIVPEERVDSGVWIATIPAEWAQQAQDDGGAEPGEMIQECNVHKITGPDGTEWHIEVPMP